MEETREQITIRLPADMKKRLQEEADKYGVSLNAMIILLLKKGLTIE